MAAKMGRPDGAAQTAAPGSPGRDRPGTGGAGPAGCRPVRRTGRFPSLPMPIPSRKYALAGLALALFAPASLGAQDLTRVTPVADDVLVRQSAFTLWWPEYDRLMREFLRNTPADAGRIALPAPEPEEFFREIAIVGRIPHPALPDVALYSV